MKIKTKSGFSCEVSDKKIGSWNLIDLFTDIREAAKKNDAATLTSTTKQLYTFLLGEEGYEALKDHLKDEDGIVDSTLIANEFNEILTLANAKKSKSSQA